MKKYTKAGKEYILCSIRKKLIQITPEELVRQQFIDKLIKNYNVPENAIDVEVPLSYFKKGVRGRIDILVSIIDKDGSKYPLMVVECKAPNVIITDKVFEQALFYTDFLEAAFMVVTNGDELYCYIWDDEKEDYLLIEDIPKYDELINEENIKYVENPEEQWKRFDYKDDIEKNRKILLDYGIIGEDTRLSLIPFITNLAGLLYDETDAIKKLALKTKKLISDGGIRYTTFGNAAGGGFTGEYRYLILENLENKENEIVSMAVMGKASTKNHPKWGNSKGYTILNIAIDDIENSHLSLEYSIDRFVEIKDNKYSFWHDGTLTVGKKGRAKNKDVIDFVKSKNPDLIVNNKIFLGTLDNAKEFTWKDKDVQQLFSNFIEYAFIRDEFRKLRKNEKI